MAEMLKVKAALASRHGIDASFGSSMVGGVKVTFKALLMFSLCLPALAQDKPKPLPYDFKSLKALAEKGDARAQYEVGDMYFHHRAGEFNGTNPTQKEMEADLKESAKWYHMAAERGHTRAQEKVAWMYYTGSCVQKDIVTAYVWYRLAAINGSMNGKNSTRITAFKMTPDQINKAEALAKELHQKIEANTLSTPAAPASKEPTLQQKPEEPTEISKELPRDIPSLKALAEKGGSRSQYMLGAAYYFGEGIDVDFKLAVEWYKKSAKQGHAKAQYSLGAAYWYGKGVTKDPVQTYMWWSLSAGNGYALAKEWIPKIAPHLTAVQVAEAKKLVEAKIPTPTPKAEAKRPVQPNVGTKAEAEKPTLTKTFENTLGMKFMPVSGTEVQFCIWETRVKDYAVYAAANVGVDARWKSPGFTQADTHPVVNVNWEDAQAFCAWLTKKEQAEGRLEPGQHYRLPTDAEWSLAVGLPTERGNSPKEKALSVTGVYPWGNLSTPWAKVEVPKKAGNYAERLGVDSFEKTSPVGSFAAYAHGLYDMGGNVNEWCEDKYDPTRTGRVLRVKRGASWMDSISDLLSSARTGSNSGGFTTGFRCVLEGNPEQTKATPNTELTNPNAGGWVSDPSNPQNVLLEAAIRAQMFGKKGVGWVRAKEGEITKADLEKVQTIGLSYKKLTDIPSLKGLGQLEVLVIHNNQITNLTPLKGLKKLKVLHLFVNQVTKLTPLEGLTKLEHLDFNANQIADLMPLMGLKELKVLRAANNQIADLTPLSGLEKLQVLFLPNNQMINLKGLERLKSLKTLDLRTCPKLADVSALANLKQLRDLDLSYSYNLTKAKITELQKALPECKILSNPTR